VVWNAAPAPVDPVELPGDIDLLVVNEGELAVVAGHLGVGAAAAPALVAAVQETLGADVVCTLGGAGAIYAIGAERGAVAAPRVQVVDTTGAGDTFVGYLCGEWAAGTGSVRDRIELATAAASLAVTRPGAAAAIPARTAVPGSRDPQRVASREGTTG
jgi:ribokinase